MARLRPPTGLFHGTRLLLLLVQVRSDCKNKMVAFRRSELLVREPSHYYSNFDESASAVRNLLYNRSREHDRSSYENVSEVWAEPTMDASLQATR